MARACSRFPMKPLNSNTRVTSKGALGSVPSSMISPNLHLSATRRLSASFTYSRAKEQPLALA